MRGGGGTCNQGRRLRQNHHLVVGAAVGVRNGADVGPCAQIAQAGRGLHGVGVPAVGVRCGSSGSRGAGRTVGQPKAGGVGSRIRRRQGRGRLCYRRIGGGGAAVGIRDGAGVGSSAHVVHGGGICSRGGVPRIRIRTRSARNRGAQASGVQAETRHVGAGAARAYSARGLRQRKRFLGYRTAGVRDGNGVGSRRQPGGRCGGLCRGGVPAVGVGRGASLGRHRCGSAGLTKTQNIRLVGRSNNQSGRLGNRYGAGQAAAGGVRYRAGVCACSQTADGEGGLCGGGVPAVRVGAHAAEGRYAGGSVEQAVAGDVGLRRGGVQNRRRLRHHQSARGGRTTVGVCYRAGVGACGQTGSGGSGLCRCGVPTVGVGSRSAGCGGGSRARGAAQAAHVGFGSGNRQSRSGCRKGGLCGCAATRGVRDG